jgi:two-component system, LuxR family, sensor kinase FixL
VRRDGTVIEFKPARENAQLTPPIKLEGRSLQDLLPAQMAAQAMRHLELTLSTGHVQTFVCQHLLSDSLRDFEARSVMCSENEVMALVRDVTERKRLEKEILEISNREQQRIGQDLHDGLGQHLTGITFLTKALQHRLAARGLPEAAEAGEIGQLVIQALAQTRNLARGLFPVELESNGLVSALKELAANISRLYQIDCHFECAADTEITNHVLATHIFRIVQEAVNNSVKHGKAGRIAITLSVSENGGGHALRVEDNGSGMPPDASTDGLGLKIIHYRARRMGGAFHIEPGTGGGTRVTVTFGGHHKPAPAP